MQNEKQVPIQSTNQPDSIGLYNHTDVFQNKHTQELRMDNNLSQNETANSEFAQSQNRKVSYIDKE